MDWWKDESASVAVIALRCSFGFEYLPLSPLSNGLGSSCNDWDTLLTSDGLSAGGAYYCSDSWLQFIWVSIVDACDLCVSLGGLA